MRWATLIASLAALLSSNGGTVLAAWEIPHSVTVPFMSSFGTAPYQEGTSRGLTWYTHHETPEEILDAGMDPRSPSTNEWIARAHYKALVKQFEQYKKYLSGVRGREVQKFLEADINRNQAIEALFDYRRGTLTVASLYDPATRRHYVSTVPRGFWSSDMRSRSKNLAPLWFSVVTGGSRPMSTSERDGLVFHAEDGACRYFEMAMGNRGIRVGDGRYYNRGAAIGAWGGTSDYNVQRSARRTTVDEPEGYRIDLCSDGAYGRGNRGCKTVSYYLAVAYNGDGRNQWGDFGPPADLCRRDEISPRIHGRADACALQNRPPRPTEIPEPNRPTNATDAPASISGGASSKPTKTALAKQQSLSGVTDPAATKKPKPTHASGKAVVGSTKLKKQGSVATPIVAKPQHASASGKKVAAPAAAAIPINTAGAVSDKGVKSGKTGKSSKSGSSGNNGKIESTP